MNVAERVRDATEMAAMMDERISYRPVDLKFVECRIQSMRCTYIFFLNP